MIKIWAFEIELDNLPKFDAVIFLVIFKKKFVMKLEEALKAAETALKDFMLFFLEYFCLIRREHSAPDADRLDINNGKLWAIVIASILIAQVILAAARGNFEFETKTVPAFTGMYLWRVLVFSLVVHFEFKFIGGKGNFATTLSQTLQGSAAVSVAAAFLAYSIFLIVYTSPTAESKPFYNGLSVLTNEFFKILLIIFYLTPRLCKAHSVKMASKIVSFFLTPLTVFAIDYLFNPNIRILFHAF